MDYPNPNTNTGLPSHPLPLRHPSPQLLCDVQDPEQHGFVDAVEIVLAQAVLWYGDCAAAITHLPAMPHLGWPTDETPPTPLAAKYGDPATARTRFDLYRGLEYVTSLLVLGTAKFGLDQAPTLASAFPNLLFDSTAARHRTPPTPNTDTDAVDWVVALDQLAQAYEVDALPADFDQAHWISPTALRAVADMIRTGTPVWPGDHRRGTQVLPQGGEPV